MKNELTRLQKKTIEERRELEAKTAQELIKEFHDINHPESLITLWNIRRAKKSAVLCVDKILDGTMMYLDDLDPVVTFWQGVKREIQSYEEKGRRTNG